MLMRRPVSRSTSSGGSFSTKNGGTYAPPSSSEKASFK
jgi:hypothetical protein